MTKIFKILGAGCPRCKELSKRVETAAKEIGIDFEIEKVTDIDKIMDFGVMATPALVIDNEVKSSGKVPSVSQLKKMFS